MELAGLGAAQDWRYDELRPLESLVAPPRRTRARLPDRGSAYPRRSGDFVSIRGRRPAVTYWNHGQAERAPSSPVLESVAARRSGAGQAEKLTASVTCWPTLATNGTDGILTPQS